MSFNWGKWVNINQKVNVEFEIKKSYFNFENIL
jgi:hypothetical protein